VVADRLLKEAGVAVLPGTDFGANGEGKIRLSYVRDLAALEKGLDRIAGFVDAVHAETKAKL
jgi:aminotransferase